MVDSESQSSPLRGGPSATSFADRAVQAVLVAAAATDSYDELTNRIANACAATFGAEFASIWRRQKDERGLSFLSLAGASDKLPMPGSIAQEAVYYIGQDAEGSDADGVTGYIAQTGRAINLPSYHDMKLQFRGIHRGKIDPWQYGNDPERGFRNLCGVPIRCGDAVVGVLKIENCESGVTPEHQNALERVGAEIGVVVHGLTLLDRHGQKLLDAVVRLSTALLKPFEPDALLQHIVDVTAEILDAEVCSLWLIDRDHSTLQLKAERGFQERVGKPPSYRLNWQARDDGEIDGLTAWIAVRKQEFWARSYANLAEHKSHKGTWDAQLWANEPARRFRCMFGVPLIAMGQVHGVLKVENKKNAPFFSPNDMMRCRLMASFVAVALELGQRLRSELLRDMTHVIRSPIAQTQVNLSALRSELQKDSPRIDRCRSYVGVLQRMLLAISGQARSLAGLMAVQQSTASREDVNIEELIERQLLAVSALAESERVFQRDGWRKVVLSLTPTEQTLAEIIFYNVLHNAVKFSPPERPIRVAMNADPQGTLAVSVEDRGSGIAPDDLRMVFTQGFRRRAEGWPDGTGMGLAGVTNALDVLGWEKTLESWPGRGTIFTVIVPKEKFRYGESQADPVSG